MPCLELEIARQWGHTLLYPYCITKRYTFKVLKGMTLMLVDFSNTEIFQSVLNIFFLHNISREDSITKTVLYGNSLFRQKYKKGFYFNVVIFPVEKICQTNWQKLNFVILIWISTIPF